MSTVVGVAGICSAENATLVAGLLAAIDTSATAAGVKTPRCTVTMQGIMPREVITDLGDVIGVNISPAQSLLLGLIRRC